MNIYEHIDYTLLKANATEKDIFELCRKAIIKNCASVCIPSHFVSYAHKIFPSLNICTVVGFPLGNSTTETKISEAIEAVNNGANEIDMVMNIGELKNKDFSYVQYEINQIKKAIGDITLKVIIETCYLNELEIAIATRIIDESLADYVKTSTGFGTRGASFDDIRIIKHNIFRGTKIKASGGIRTKKDMNTYIRLGCDRIGASQLP